MKHNPKQQEVGCRKCLKRPKQQQTFEAWFHHRLKLMKKSERQKCSDTSRTSSSLHPPEHPEHVE